MGRLLKFRGIVQAAPAQRVLDPLVGRHRPAYPGAPKRGHFSDALVQYASFHGRRAAAWLVWQHRARLKREGMLSFLIKRGEEVPGWFDRAFSTLARSPKWFAKSWVGDDGARHYLVERKARDGRSAK